MTTAKPLRADARRNRDALLAKARELFAAGDFDLRFDDFARLAGVGTGTLYRHFPTRAALAEAVYREELTALCDRARELQAALPAAEALAAFLHGFVDHLHTHQGLARTLATLMAGRSDTLADGGRELDRAIADLLAAGVEEGTIRDDVGAGAVMMVLQGICTACGDQLGARDDADGAVTLVLDGLRRRAAGDAGAVNRRAGAPSRTRDSAAPGKGTRPARS